MVTITKAVEILKAGHGLRVSSEGGGFRDFILRTRGDDPTEVALDALECYRRAPLVTGISKILFDGAMVSFEIDGEV